MFWFQLVLFNFMALKGYCKPVECKCEDNFTCRYCLHNKKPAIFTPSKPESFEDYCKRKK